MEGLRVYGLDLPIENIKIIEKFVEDLGSAAKAAQAAVDALAKITGETITL